MKASEFIQSKEETKLPLVLMIIYLSTNSLRRLTIIIIISANTGMVSVVALLFPCPYLNDLL
jgi:hypothetical protein